MRIQQKLKVESLLKWPNLILYPSKYGDKHQNHFDTMHSNWDIDERAIFPNGGLNFILGGLPKDDRVELFRFLKNTPWRNANSKKSLYGGYCKVLQKSRVWQPVIIRWYGFVQIQLVATHHERKKVFQRLTFPLYCPVTYHFGVIRLPLQYVPWVWRRIIIKH